MADVGGAVPRALVRVFDTTLRDGEQSPGASLTAQQKVELARQLDTLGVDVIEAGFPIASPGDLDAVKRVSRVVRNAEVAALARCVKGDIETAALALEGAKRPVLHIFMATSDIHLRHKLGMSRTEVVQRVAEMTSYARQFCARVEFSAEDATRSDWDYLACVCETAVRAGADTINLPDTVGYSVPEEISAFFTYVMDRVSGDAMFSAHCHDDLGLATANTLSAIAAGARQIEVTMNGLGERAGNAPLEEVVMALKIRGESLSWPAIDIDSRLLVPTSQMVSAMTGLAVQANKSVVGINAFAHEAGIHQDGYLKERATYEIMNAADVGWQGSRLVLGKHSGRHGLAFRLAQLGFQLNREELDQAYLLFVEIADLQKRVEDDDLRAIIARLGRRVAQPVAAGR
ncbi:MAG: 2-isopropylmalate synthase [Chloroflexota bacterium]